MEADAQAWGTLRVYMRSHCGVELSDTQQYLMEARLAPVAKAYGMASANSFVLEACKATAAQSLAKALVDAMTTHESHFFRDASFWTTLEQQVIPKCVAATGGQLRVLSTACSYGQEVYSLAMLIAEKWPETFAKLDIVASDVSEGALARARAGVYTSLEVNRGLVAARLLRYFDKAEGGFRVKPNIAKVVSFSSHNLLEPLPSQRPFDIILCRNVLIYFGDADRRKVLAHLLKGLAPHGFVGLGAGELYLGAPLPGGFYERPKLSQERK